MQVAEEIQLGEERQFLRKLLEKHQAAHGENKAAMALFFEIEALTRYPPHQPMIVNKNIVHLLAICARMATQHVTEHIPWDTSQGSKVFIQLLQELMKLPQE